MSLGVLGSLCVMGVGILMVFFGRGKERLASSVARYPRVPAGAASPGGSGAVDGVASSPMPLFGPLTNRPCVFYEELVERRVVEEVYDVSASRYRTRVRWETAARNQVGGFFVDDSSGRVFVPPGAASLQVSDSRTRESGDGDGTIRRTESLIEPGRVVCALGSFESLESTLAAMREDGVEALTPGLLDSLMDLGKAGRAPVVLRPSLLSDRSHEETIKELSSSADLQLSFGWMMAGLGLFGLVASYLGFL